jgi:hypothetical protein
MVKQKMFQKNLILVVTLLSVPVSRGSLAASGLIGSAAPYFRVQSGDDKELTLDMIKGKVARHILREQRHCGRQQETKG